MARISLDPPRTLSYRIGGWFIRRQFGEVLDPFRAMGHNMSVAQAYGKLEQSAAQWRKLDMRLRDLADMAAARQDRLSVVHGFRLLDIARARNSTGEDRGGAALAREQRVQSAGAFGHGVRRGNDRDAAPRRR